MKLARIAEFTLGLLVVLFTPISLLALTDKSGSWTRVRLSGSHRLARERVNGFLRRSPQPTRSTAA